MKYCYDCHGDGAAKGSVAFDAFASTDRLISEKELWAKALKNVRAGLMPPDDGGPKPSAPEIDQLATWIKRDAFGLDPKDPDPGRVTIRRLNRVEYHNTIRDLMGVDFAADVEFPPDDSGHGFDNLGEVLTVSPLLLEKYLQAAEEIVDQAVPRVSRVPRKRVLSTKDFHREKTAAPEAGLTGAPIGQDLNARTGGTTACTLDLPQAGTYKLSLKVDVRGTFDFDDSRATLVISADGQELKRQEINWSTKPVLVNSELQWAAGVHHLTVALQPLNPADPAKPEVAAVVAGATAAKAPGPDTPKPAARSVTVRSSAELVGPMEKNQWIPPDNYRRFFVQDVPTGSAERDAYAEKVLRDFTTKAFRRPVDDAKIRQLAGIARGVYTEPGKVFEDGVARAMMAVLASPRFLFRLEDPAPNQESQRFPAIDDHALAVRLSYFLWSSTPDAELTRLAQRGELRPQLMTQVSRMLKDAKSQGFVRNFSGQWLQARDVETVPINARAILGAGDPKSNLSSKVDFNGALRKAMRAETEMVFDYIMREDSSVLEFIDADYTFLNATLAKHYGLPDVEGDTLRRITLPAGSPRGGVLTEGTVLAVTSNPTRTSPVKRGLFVLDNILGTPPPPPPPNIPALEESAKGSDGHELPLREALALHRADKLCASCHARMDPLGFALENFNAMGNWRELDARKPIDPSGRLVTGENFADIRELKRLLTHERRLDFYRCLTEKMLTYALGRGLETCDVETVDQIVGRLDHDQGRFSTLLTGIVGSTPFQKMRRPESALQANATNP